MNYLIFTPSAYTSDDLKSYKSLQAYNNFIEGWLKDIKAFKAMDNIVVVAARVSIFHGLILCSPQLINECDLRPSVSLC